MKIGAVCRWPAGIAVVGALAGCPGVPASSDRDGGQESSAPVLAPSPTEAASATRAPPPHAVPLASRPSQPAPVLGSTAAPAVNPTPPTPTAHAPLPPTAPTCPSGQLPGIFQLEGRFETLCSVPCAADPNCPPGQICDATSIAGQPGATIKVCHAGQRSAPSPAPAPPPPPPTHDAGTLPSPPPSAPPLPPVILDAGARPRPPPPSLLPIKTLLVGGACATGYTSVGKFCRLECTNDSACAFTPGSRCAQQKCFGPGENP